MSETPSGTAVRKVAGKPGESYKRCTGCERRARNLLWLMHVETELPLTMPLCGDCFKDAAQRVERLLAEIPAEGDFGNHPAAA